MENSIGSVVIEILSFSLNKKLTIVNYMIVPFCDFEIIGGFDSIRKLKNTIFVAYYKL